MWTAQGLLITTALGILVTGALATSAVDLDEFRRENPDLTEFMSLIATSLEFKFQLEFKQGTIFAPTNSALDEYRRAYPNGLNNFTLLYHYTYFAIPLAELEEGSLPTELPGNLRVWVTKINQDFFINGAKILRGNSRVRTGTNKLEQIVHTINKVLEPTVPIANIRGSSKLNNPDAKKYLEFSQDYGISRPYNTSTFFRHVQKLGRLDSFGSPGKFTFFLPVSDAFVSTRIKSVDNTTIDGHIVVGKTIFLEVNNGTNKRHPTFETSAAAGNFPVVVTIDYSKYSNSWSVMSENLVDDPKAKHRKGKVRAEILKANIPVKNGVVHLISRPLVVIDSNVYKLMQEDGEHGPLSKFFELINEYPDIRQILSDTGKDKRVTVFVPASSVLENSSNFQELLNKSKKPGPEQAEAKQQLEQILKLHIVKHEITSEDIIKGTQNKSHPFHIPHFTAKPLAANKELYFTVESEQRERIVVLDGGGTSATIWQADIGATNGVIHIVNHILGIGEGTTRFVTDSERIPPSTNNTTSHQLKKPEKDHTHVWMAMTLDDGDGDNWRPCQERPPFLPNLDQ